MEPELATHRRSLLAGLSGQVLELGAGNGLNFAHYPVEVTRVLAVEPEPHLRALAIDSAAKAAVPVEVVDGVADRLPAGESSIDAAVASLVLCSVPDQASALDEIRRVLRPGGQLRFDQPRRRVDGQPGQRGGQRVVVITGHETPRRGQGEQRTVPGAGASPGRYAT